MDKQENGIVFRLQDWRAWAPGLDDQAQWRSWLAHNGRPHGDERADVSFLPPMQRRRLGHMARMGFRVMEDCLGESAADLPLIFASRHGELERSYRLLRSLAESEPLSPRDFSLSVHNAILGLYSIARENRQPASAVAAGLDSLPAGLLETALQATLRGGDCLLVWAERSLPDFYRPFLPDDAPVACLGLRIGPADGPGDGPLFRLSWGAADGGPLCHETQVLHAFLSGLIAAEGGSHWRSERRQWSLEAMNVAT